jgi:hypothetical protein
MLRTEYKLALHQFAVVRAAALVEIERKKNERK